MQILTAVGANIELNEALPLRALPTSHTHDAAELPPAVPIKHNPCALQSLRQFLPLADCHETFRHLKHIATLVSFVW